LQKRERIMTAAAQHPHPARLGIIHLLVVGASVLGALFILCWAGDAVGWVPATHRFVSIFTDSPETSSPAALAEGLPMALGFGALAGATLAIFYNLFSFLGRR
jgi:hypothetical protein